MTRASSQRSRLLASMIGSAALLGAALCPGVAAAAPDLQLPFPCSQKWRLDTWGHAPALDMVKEPNQQGTEGATIVAPGAGTVNQSFYHNEAGNVIQINHGGGYYTTYLHLQSRSVSEGAKVSPGTVIGKVGKTGPTSNGHPHLHFELGYDANKDGQASWGYAEAERIKPTFKGITYGQKNNQTSRNVTSQNECGSTPPPDGKYWVDTFADASGYSSPSTKNGERTGTLNQGTNYVYCRQKGEKVQHGRDYNTWWLKTDLDTGDPRENQWVSAYYLKRWGNDQAKDNSGRDIPNC